jgi:hypothetical protein
MSNFDEPYDDSLLRGAQTEYEEFVPEVGQFEQPGYTRQPLPSVQDHILNVIEMVHEAKPLPLSNMIRIGRDELLEALEIAVENLPYELAEAQRALREREALMAEERARAEEIIARAESLAAQLIEQTEVVRQARLEAQSIVNEAAVAARKMVTQHEDYLDRKLADFENILSNLLSTTQKGRSRLAAEPMPLPTDTVATAEQFFAGDPAAATPFDYDAEVGDTDGAR